jgi:hypothetical protein
VALKGTAAGIPAGRPVVANEPQAKGNGRQDDASDLRPGQRPTDGRTPAVVPASATQPKKPAADGEPEDVRQ